MRRRTCDSLPRLKVFSAYYRVSLRSIPANRGLRGIALAEYGDDFALNLPLLIPLRFGNKNGIHGGVRGLQAHAVLLFFLVETLQRGLTIALQVNGHHDIALFAGRLWLDDHIVLVANVIFDHRLSAHHQRISSLLLKVAPGFDDFIRFIEYLEWLTCGDTAEYANAPHLLLELDTATLFRLALNHVLFFQHRQVIIHMTSTG